MPAPATMRVFALLAENVIRTFMRSSTIAPTLIQKAHFAHSVVYIIHFIGPSRSSMDSEKDRLID
jgi:hypothetical protein